MNRTLQNPPPSALKRFPITLDGIPAVRHPYINSGPRDSRTGLFLLYSYYIRKKYQGEN